MGQSVNIEKRILGHLRDLRRQDHNNSDIQSDFNLYGKQSFYFEIIEECVEEKLLETESKWIRFGENLYNKTNPSRHIEFTESEKIRFWNWVKIGQDEECWEWFGASDKDGYGRMGFKRDYKKRMFRANRLAYFITNPDTDIHCVVRHTCNNKKCCNPKHLITGSFSDNAKDKRNDDNNIYKLDWHIVKEIRNEFTKNPRIHRKRFHDWFISKFNINIPSSYLVKVCFNIGWEDPDYNLPTNSRLRYFPSEHDIELIRKSLKENKRHTDILNVLISKNIPISPTNLSRYIKRIRNGDL